VEDGRWGWKINGIKTASSTNLYILQSTICILKGGRWKIETYFLYERKAGDKEPWQAGIKSIFLFSDMAGIMYFCKDSIFKQTT
jgi:hypothetical protein